MPVVLTHRIDARMFCVKSVCVSLAQASTPAFSHHHLLQTQPVAESAGWVHLWLERTWLEPTCREAL